MKTMDRIVEHWEDGCCLYRVDIGYILIFKKTFPLFSINSQAEPLMKFDYGYSNVIWTPSDIPIRSISKSHCYLMHHGTQLNIELSDSNRFDPAGWLDISKYELKEVKTLGHISKPTFASIGNPAVRDVFSEPSLKESDQLKETIKKLKAVKDSPATINNDRPRKGSLIFDALKRAFNTDVTSSHANKVSKSGPASRPDYSPTNTNNISFFDRIKSIYSDILMRSQLGKIIGHSQAKFIQDMIDQFENGDLHSAMRNALPLGNLKDAIEGSKKSTGKLAGLGSLEINTHSHNRGTSITLADNIENQLRAMYERAFKKLDDSGEYKEAGFVLAELLRDTDRAVTYLEKHKFFQLAAELAEGQYLEPPRIIRQWVIAKDYQRAMHIAVISGCYEQAITLLENTNKESANKLRWVCAEHHYKIGNIGRAIDIAWPLINKRKTLIIWLRESSQLGGGLAAQHLVRLVNCDDENHSIYIEQLRKTLDKTDLALLPVIKEIIGFGAKEFNSLLAKLVLRMYLQSVSSGRIVYSSKHWASLCDISGDLTLRADTRNLNVHAGRDASPLLSLKEPLQLSMPSANGRQASSIVELINGNFLVVFGEAGLEYWSSNGKLKSHFHVPCQEIILADNGIQALLVCERSGYFQINKFNLLDETISPWIDISITSYAKTYDGNMWAVSDRNQLLMLDVTADTMKAAWHVNDLDGLITHIERSTDFISFSLVSDVHLEIWTYSLPNLFLKERNPFTKNSLKSYQLIAMKAGGLMAAIKEDDSSKLGLLKDETRVNWDLDLSCAPKFIAAVIVDDYLIISESTNTLTAKIYSIKHTKVDHHLLTISFTDSGEASFKIKNDQVLINHSSGQVYLLDLIHGKVLNEFIL